MKAFRFHFPPRTIGGHVTFALNATLIALFTTFMTHDFPRVSAEHIANKKTSLQEQSRIAIITFRDLSTPAEIQKRLDELRWQMAESHTDEHVLALEKDGEFFVSGLSITPTPMLATEFRSTRSESLEGLTLGNRDFVFGSHSEGAMIAYIGEDLVATRTILWNQFLRRFGFIGITLLAGTIIMNVVLWRAMHRPIRALEKAASQIGKGKLGLQIQSAGAGEFDTLVSAINLMSQELGDKERDNIAQMKKALAIQTSLLPSKISTQGFEIARHFQPAAAIGGEYYDLLELPDGSHLICVADVTGHGVSAAMVAAMVKICVLSAAEQWSDPGKILGFVDRRLGGMNLPDMFVSMFLVRIFDDRAYLEYAGAGHPSAYLIGTEEHFRELKSEGPLLGIGADLQWETRRATFADGDRLVVYTDGVTEAASPKSGLFGVQRLIQSIQSTRMKCPADSILVVMDQLNGFFDGQPANDDITLLIIDRSAKKNPRNESGDFDQINAELLAGTVA